jgi:hypothetical protein
LLDAYRVLLTELGEDHSHTKSACKRLADLYQAWGRPEQAARYRRSPSSSSPGTAKRG